MEPSDPTRRLGTRLALVGLVALVSCSAPESSGPQPAPSPEPSAALASPTPSATPAPPPSPTKSPRPAPRVRHVVVVSLDGLGTGLINQVGVDNLPTITELTLDGASTFNARTEVEQTVTLPNHAGMLTGRPVDPADGGHGVFVNVDPGVTVHDLAGEQVFSVFDVVRASGGSTALFTTKDKFALFDRSWPIDRFHFAPDSDALMDAAASDVLASRRAFTFIHLGLVDDAGHASGWGSADQLAAVRHADELLGELFAAVASDPRLERRTAFVVTSDHGGVGRAHGNATDPHNYTVPFWVLGSSVASGSDLYLLNPDLADPGTAQPPYDAERGPVRNGFVANLVTELLGLGPVPGSVFAPDGLVLGIP